MKNLLKVSSIAFVALAIFTSCEDDDNNVIIEEKEIEEAISLQEIQNNNNPYENQGEIYTGLLNSMEQEQTLGDWNIPKLTEYNGGTKEWNVGQINRNQPENGWSLEDLNDLAMQYYQSNSAINTHSQEQLFMQLDIIASLEMVSPKHECELYPERCFTYPDEEEALNPNEDVSPRDRVINFINLMIEKESNIMENEELEDIQKRNQLVTSSIMRHTAVYWFNQTRKEEESNGEIIIDMIKLSSLGSKSILWESETPEIAVSIAALSGYVASGRAE